MFGIHQLVEVIKSEMVKNSRKSSGAVMWSLSSKAKIVEVFNKTTMTPKDAGAAIKQGFPEIGGRWAQNLERWAVDVECENYTLEEAVSVRRLQKPEAEIHKQMTVDVAHRLVAFDCELGSLQAQYENYKESVLKELDRQLEVIHTLSHEMNTLKAEYNVA